MGGCIDCKFHESEITGFENGKSVMARKCVRGNTGEHTKWWNDNGRRKRGELDDVECHEYGELTKLLISMNDKTQEILDKWKNIR